MRVSQLKSLLLLICSCLLLSGCFSSMMGKLPSQEINEQLYIDARLGFAIKHPLEWHRLQIPVSSPQYRSDTVRWQVNDLQQHDRGSGEMLIRSLVTDPQMKLPDLLRNYLAEQPELQASQVEEVTLPSGPALKQLGRDGKQGRLTFALKGKDRDFIISLVYPSSRFDELLPVFQDIVNSFTEVTQTTIE